MKEIFDLLKQHKDLMRQEDLNLSLMLFGEFANLFCMHLLKNEEW
jgi:hypothetical protein